jgi:hypothetical protein
LEFAFGNQDDQLPAERLQLEIGRQRSLPQIMAAAAASFQEGGALVSSNEERGSSRVAKSVLAPDNPSLATLYFLPEKNR